MLKVLKKTIIVILIVILAVSALAQGLLNLQFRQSDKKILKKLAHQNVRAKIDYLEIGDRLVRTIALERNDTLPYIFFIHGAPGSSADFLKYMEDSTLSENFNLITYDRPGYGYSGFGDSMNSIKKQALVLKDIIENYHTQNLYLVAHSFGGPIAVRLEMDFPGTCKGMILLAPALDPRHEKVLKIAHLAHWPVAKWLTPTALKVAADEKFSHIEQLKEMLPFYSSVNTKILHIHGTKDSLVPFENLDFAEKQFSNCSYQKIELKGEDHFIPWTQYDLIKREIIKMARHK